MNVMVKSFALALIFGSVLLFAQANKNYDGPRPEVYQGSQSFVFMYTPFQSDLEPVYVGTVTTPFENMYSIDLFGAGYQYYVTNQIALVFGLSYGTRSTSYEDDTEKTESSETVFGISVSGNYHLTSLYSVSPYIGVNLNYGLYSGSYDSTPAGEEVQTTDYSGNGFGVAAQCGFDWYFTEGLSLGGKYALGFQSLGKPKVTYPDGTEAEGSSTTSFGISTFSVILNVHM
jgi:hypothetical protein